MSRSKLIVYVALALGVVLVIAFVIQVKQLRQQLRSSLRIVPGESKTQENVAKQELEHGASPGRPDVLVKFRAGVSPESAKQICARFNDELLDQIEAVPGLAAIDDRKDSDVENKAAQYRSLPEVEYAEPNYEINIARPTNLATAAEDMNEDVDWTSQIGLPEAWTKTKGSRGVVVGILDSGVADTPDLAGNIWTRPASIAPYHDQDLGTVDDLHGFNAITNDGEVSDDNGHGTASAGIIGNDCADHTGPCGVSPQTSIMVLKCLNAGGVGTVADAVEAVNYAIDRKHAGVNIRVINVGWGFKQQSRALEDAIRSAGAAGILFVVASGDAHENIDEQPYYPANYHLENVICVAGLARGENLSPFSNYGPRSVSIAAPSVNRLATSTGNGYQPGAQTSVAAAIVSGVAILALSKKPDLSVAQLRALLLSSVDLLPGLKGKVATSGRINAAKAVRE